jgi:hypothetical protein
MPTRFALVRICLIALACGSVVVLDAKVKIRANFDKNFDFSTVRTWTWDSPPGKPVLLRSADDNPEAVRQQLEPTILEAVASELKGRGLTQAPAAPADVTVTYYLVVTVGAQTEYLGYNLPGSISWTLPPINPSTSRFDIVQRGSIVVDLTSPAKKAVVWRGIAEAEIDRPRSDEERKARIRDAVKKIAAKYPPKT